jgi:hypothetical protein
MKIALFAALLACVAAPSFAQQTLFGGRPQVVYEIEHEKAADKSGHANSVTLYPGIRWKEGWINELEVMLKYEREAEAGSQGFEIAHERALGVRVRSIVHFTDNFGGFFRGLIGRRFQPEPSYTYAYVEPALTYKLEPLDWYTGYRFVRAIDGSSGRDYDQWRMGPGWDINEHNEIELRITRSWDAVTRARRSDSIEIEYTYKY